MNRTVLYTAIATLGTIFTFWAMGSLKDTVDTVNASTNTKNQAIEEFNSILSKTKGGSNTNSTNNPETSKTPSP